MSVPAAHTYYEPVRPFLPVEEQAPVLTRQQEHDEVLDLADVLGKRLVATRLKGNVTVREENARAALEAMSRFAESPRWLVYLPPTMSPCETSAREGFLEHPAEAFAHYRNEGIPRVVCEEKHMGSRAVLVVCRDEDVARKRFGAVGEGIGTCVTRTGRRFFDDAVLQTGLLERVRRAAGSAGLWDELGTDWLVLDAELMPWSAKAQQLLRTQYAPVGVAATTALPLAASLLDSRPSDSPDRAAARERFRERAELAERYVKAWRGYCWPVASLADLKLAPFHLMASHGAVHTSRPHAWHLDVLRRLAATDPELLVATRHLEVDVTDPESEAAGMRFWEDLTSGGGEGMVVKPSDFLARGRRGLVQPALKVRGPEYLRIIYGPEYSLPGNLERLRKRGLAAKRSLAHRELALGIEGLERFVRNEPLRRVHECVFGVLALESEPVDPRL